MPRLVHRKKLQRLQIMVPPHIAQAIAAEAEAIDSSTSVLAREALIYWYDCKNSQNKTPA